MGRLKTIKLAFLFAVVMLLAKPLLGFGFLNRANHPLSGQYSMFMLQKAFSKRKQEYVEDSIEESVAIQNSLAEPVLRLLLRFSALLGILFSAIVDSGGRITNCFINAIKLSLLRLEQHYLFTGKLII